MRGSLSLRPFQRIRKEPPGTEEPHELGSSQSVPGFVPMAILGEIKLAIPALCLEAGGEIKAEYPSGTQELNQRLLPSLVCGGLGL
jgi:hypothetical protein